MTTTMTTKMTPTTTMTTTMTVLQWTNLQLLSFAIAPVFLLIVLLLKNDDWGAIANESTVDDFLFRLSLSAALPRF